MLVCKCVSVEQWGEQQQQQGLPYVKWLVARIVCCSMAPACLQSSMAPVWASDFNDCHCFFSSSLPSSQSVRRHYQPSHHPHHHDQTSRLAVTGASGSEAEQWSSQWKWNWVLRLCVRLRPSLRLQGRVKQKGLGKEKKNCWSAQNSRTHKPTGAVHCNLDAIENLCTRSSSAALIIITDANGRRRCWTLAAGAEMLARQDGSHCHCCWWRVSLGQWVVTFKVDYRWASE